MAHEGETGKVSRANFDDRLGRIVLIMRPGMQVTFKFGIYLLMFVNQPNITYDLPIKTFLVVQNTTSAEDNIRHLVYLIENAILNLPEGQEQMSWLIDFTGWTLNTNISVKTARDIIYILQNHYPERLAIVFLYNPPRFFEAFWKVHSHLSMHFWFLIT